MYSNQGNVDRCRLNDGHSQHVEHEVVLASTTKIFRWVAGALQCDHVRSYNNEHGTITIYCLRVCKHKGECNGIDIRTGECVFWDDDATPVNMRRPAPPDLATTTRA